MREQYIYDNFPKINFVKNTREQLELSPINIDLLRKQAGSLDAKVAKSAQNELIRQWDLKPESDSLSAESVDINDQLSIFSEKEQKVMFDNMVAIQLTEGCNGNCNFCMFGDKKGVDAKYSFESLNNLFHNKHEMMSNNSFVLYWNSDPFDYRDGKYTFVDVYKLYRDKLPNNFQYISTAMPRGGTHDFIQFMSYLITEDEKLKGTGANRQPIRISISKQNIQRVEGTLLMLTNTLLDSGHSLSDVNNFYNTHLTTVGRFNNWILPLGPNIKNADDIKDTFSTACRDGVVISPKSVQAVMMTAATIYEPSGQTNLELKKNGELDIPVPMKVRDEVYSRFSFVKKELYTRDHLKYTMLPVIKNADGSEYSLPRILDDKILKLGREVATFVRLIFDYSKINTLQVESPSDPLTEKKLYLKTSAETFKDRREYTQDLISSAEIMLDKDSLSKDEYKKVQYYILLAKVYLTKVDYLVNQIENDKSVETIGIMASTLASVGRDKIDELPAIMKKLELEGK
jgi:hypothetical protein